MSKLYIRNWCRWQSMRKNRPGMIWVKLYRDILKDAAWADMTDAEKGQYVSLLLVADPFTGMLPSEDERVLRKICQIDTLDLTRMVALRLTTGHPTVVPEESTVEKRTGEKRGSVCPHNWHCNESTYKKLLTTFGVSEVEEQRVRFVDWCAANGRAYKDHDAAFRNWMNNSNVWNRVANRNGHAVPAEGQDIFGRKLEDVTPH